MEEIVLQRLRQALKIKALSATLLAGFLKINPSTLISKLNGTRGMDIDTLCIILNFYKDLSAEWLFRGTEPMFYGMKNPNITPATTDFELKEMFINQAREIRRLEMRILELEQKEKESAS